MAYVKNPTADQRQKWAEDMLQQEKEVKQLILKTAEEYQENPENIVELVTFGSKFYRYSTKNNLLVYAQNPNANYVQSFAAWKKAGYTVKKGEKGLKVYVPVQTTILKVGDKLVPLEQASKEEKIQYQAGEIESITKSKFKVGTVFDVSQTTYPKEKYPQLFQVGYPTSYHAAIVKGLINYAEKNIGCRVQFKNLNSISLRGNYNPATHEININELLEDTHKLGHALMQHLPGDNIAQSEFEGDAVGIILATHFGVEVTESRRRHCIEQYKEYLNTDEIEKKDLVQTLDRVYRVCRKSIPAIQKEVELYLGSETAPMRSMHEKGRGKANSGMRKLSKSEIYDEIKQKIKIVDYAREMGYTVERKGRYYSFQEHDSVRIDPERNCFWRNSGKGITTSGSIIDFAMEFKHNGDIHAALTELTSRIDTTVPEFSGSSGRIVQKPDPVIEKMKLLYGEVFKKYHMMQNGLNIQELQNGKSTVAKSDLNTERYLPILKKLETSIQEKKPVSFSKEEEGHLKLLGSDVANRLDEMQHPEGLPKKLELPEKAENMKRVYAYLIKSRYLDQDVVQDFVDRKMLYQDQRGNCIFVAYDENKIPNFACKRGTLTDKKFMGDIAGSDYSKDFYVSNNTNKLIITESVIDAMSVMSILKGQGKDYKEYDYLVLTGTGKFEAVLNHLQEKPREEILLALDNDEAGVKSMNTIASMLAGKGMADKVSLHIPESKDWNQDLVNVASKFKSLTLVPFLEELAWPMEIEGFSLKESLCMANIIYRGNKSEEMLEFKKGQYFITTGMMADNTYMEHPLTDKQVQQLLEFKQALGSQLQEINVAGVVQFQEVQEKTVGKVASGQSAGMESAIDSKYIMKEQSRFENEEAPLIEDLIQYGYDEAKENLLLLNNVLEEDEEINVANAVQFQEVQEKMVGKVASGQSVGRESAGDKELPYIRQIQQQEFQKNKGVSLMPTIEAGIEL